MQVSCRPPGLHICRAGPLQAPCRTHAGPMQATCRPHARHEGAGFEKTPSRGIYCPSSRATGSPRRRSDTAVTDGSPPIAPRQRAAPQTHATLSLAFSRLPSYILVVLSGTLVKGQTAVIYRYSSVALSSVAYRTHMIGSYDTVSSARTLVWPRGTGGKCVRPASCRSVCSHGSSSCTPHAASCYHDARLLEDAR